MKRQLRTLQSYFPFVRPLKFKAYNIATRYFGWHIDPEFRLLAKLRPFPLALDIGGNWGQSIHALKVTARPDKIVSFEPNAVLARQLSQDFSADRNVAIENCALGDEDGRFHLHVPSYGNYIYDGLASLDEDEAKGWLNADRMVHFNPAKLTIDRQEVVVRKLDDFDFAPGVVKIDVQGAELAVVKGGLETFRRHQPVAIIEAPSSELVELLGSIGLRAYRFDGQKLHDDWDRSTNAIFLSDAHMARLNI